MSKSRFIIGLMSGTSVDAVDAALVRVTRRGGRYGAEVLEHVAHHWPAGLRGRLLAVMAPAETTTQEICTLNMAVAREFAVAVEKLLRAAGLPRGKIAAIASHGQTIGHLPPAASARGRVQDAEFGSTLQIGDASALATLTEIPVVGNFRAADMAVGGQGAPLVPWADAQLFSHATGGCCVQNIGGIANVTYLPAVTERGGAAARQRGAGVQAFDTGPGNMLLDAVVRLATQGRTAYDRDGRRAARGTLDAGLLRRLQGHPFFARRPPKSTGREAFGAGLAEQLFRQALGKSRKAEDRAAKIESLLHTLTRLTAWSIADAYRRHLPRMPEEVILCGGGADNPVLVGMLAEELGGGRARGEMRSGHLDLDLRRDADVAPLSRAQGLVTHGMSAAVRLRRIDEFGIPNKAKEAASFALLGAATLDGVPGNVPGVTGARRAVVLGEVARPVRGAR